MKNLLLVIAMGLSLTLGACAHKHGGCKEGSCKMEKKECGCKHEVSKEAAPTPTK